MKNIFLLTKVGLLSAFSTQKSKKRKAAKATGVGAYLLGGLLLLSLVGVYGYMLCEVGAWISQPQLVLSLGAAIGMLMALFLGIAKTPGALFAAKDFETLSALPITATELFLSKLTLVYTFAFSSVGMILFPFSVAYAIRFGVSVTLVLSVLAALIFLPMLCAAISGVIALVISRLASRFRSTNAAMIVLSLVFIVAVFAFSFTMGMASEDEAAMLSLFSGISSTLNSILPVKLFVDGVGGSLLSVVALMALCAAPFGLFSLLCARIFRRINIALGEKHMRADYKAKDLHALKQGSASAALFRRELKLYTSTYVYVMNTIVGPIMGLLMAGLLFFGGPGLFADVPTEELAVLEAVILPLYLVIVCFAMAVAPPTSAGISLEGDRLWILKSLPVRTVSIFWTKIKLQLLLTVPVAVLAALSALFVFQPSDPVILVSLFLVPLLFSLFAGLSGLAVNLLLPNLTWKNPVVPVKKGAAVLVTMLVNFLMIALPVVMHTVAGMSLSIVLPGAILLLTLGCAALWLWLRSKGVKRFAAL